MSPTLNSRSIFALVLLLGGLSFTPGCSRDSTPQTTQSGEASQADVAAPANPPRESEGASFGSLATNEPANAATRPVAAMPGIGTDQPYETTSPMPGGENAPANPPAPSLPTLALADAGENAAAENATPALQLRSDLTPQNLVDFLSASDEDMQLIYSGRAGLKSEAEAVREMERIITMKLEASRRLMEHPEADAAQKRVGRRGELQSLSHLASRGDLKSATELESIANEGLASDDPQLVSDSRLVLLGFAIESLQNGKPAAAKRIVELVEQYAANDQAPDVPAMMVMGEARALLVQYGHVDEAARVRSKILDSFGKSSNPEIAMMAANLAGAVQFDKIDRLRSEAMRGAEVSVEDWVAATKQLVGESADLLTVQYLAGTALEFEGAGNSQLAEATYASLESGFASATGAIEREVEVALAARQSRQRMIGQAFAPKLASLEGESIEMSDYVGRVVLLPFWTAAFPASLQMIPRLDALRQAHPNDVAIVGVNLDPRADESTANAKQRLGFPSLHSPTDPSAAVPNPIASQFGMVSMPFLVVLDRQGKVAEICFTEQQLREVSAKLLDPTTGQ